MKIGEHWGTYSGVVVQIVGSSVINSKAFWRVKHPNGGTYEVNTDGDCRRMSDLSLKDLQSAEKPSNPKDLVGVRKAPMSTMSAAVLAEVGVAMLEGACKYGRHNYRAVGVSASVYYDGTMRHLMGWWEGEDIDADSNLSHITKAITSLVVLRDAMIQNKFTDDRPPRSPEFYARLNTLAGEIIDRHADKSPRHYTIADVL